MSAVTIVTSERRNVSAAPHRERSFGLSVGIVCGVFAAVAAWRGRPTSPWILGVLASLLIVVGLAHPAWLTVTARAWYRLAHVLGWINSRVLLSVFYIIIITPVGMIRRLIGADPLRLRRRSAVSGWVPYPERLRNPKHYERLF